MTEVTPIDVLPVINELSRTTSSAEAAVSDSFQFHEDEAEVFGAGKVKYDRLTCKKYSDKSEVDFEFTSDADDADVAPTVVVDDVDMSFSATSDWDFV